MKKNIYRLLLSIFPVLALVPSCKDVDEFYRDILPEEFQREILSFKEYGVVEANVEISNEFEYPVTIFKGGVKTTSPTEVQIRVLSQDELDETVNDVQGTDYVVMPDTYFSLESSTLTIPADRAGITTNLLISSKKLSQKSSKKVYVLPLRLESAADSINVQRKDLVVIPKLVPAEISFEKTADQVKLDADAQKQTFQVNLKKTAKVAIPCEVMPLSQKYVTDEYSAEVDYKVVPEMMYKIQPSRVTLPVDDSITSIDITLNTRDIIKDMQKAENADRVYVIALRLVTSSTFAVVSPTAYDTLIILSKE